MRSTVLALWWCVQTQVLAATFYSYITLSDARSSHASILNILIVFFTVLILFLQIALEAFALCQLAKQYLCCHASVLLVNQVSRPCKLMFLHYGLSTHHIGQQQYYYIKHIRLPWSSRQRMQATLGEVIKVLDTPAIVYLSLTSTQQNYQGAYPVDLYLVGARFQPKYCLKLYMCITDLRKSIILFVIKDFESG